MNTKKKSSILKSATNHFLSNGFRNASMTQIALDAQVSKRTLYKYFKSKEDIFLAIIEELKNLINQNNTKFDLIYEVPFPRQLELVIDDYAELVSSPNNLILYRLIMSELCKEEPILTSKIRQLIDAKNFMFKWVRNSQKQGYFKNSISYLEIAETIDAFVCGSILFPLLSKQKEEFSSKKMNNIKKHIYDSITSLYCQKS